MDLFEFLITIGTSSLWVVTRMADLMDPVGSFVLAEASSLAMSTLMDTSVAPISSLGSQTTLLATKESLSKDKCVWVGLLR